MRWKPLPSAASIDTKKVGRPFKELVPMVWKALGMSKVTRRSKKGWRWTTVGKEDMSGDVVMDESFQKSKKSFIYSKIQKRSGCKWSSRLLLLAYWEGELFLGQLLDWNRRVAGDRSPW